MGCFTALCETGQSVAFSKKKPSASQPANQPKPSRQSRGVLKQIIRDEAFCFEGVCKVAYR